MESSVSQGKNISHLFLCQQV